MQKQKKKKVKFILKLEKTFYRKLILHRTKTETKFFLQIREYKITPKLANYWKGLKCMIVT